MKHRFRTHFILFFVIVMMLVGCGRKPKLWVLETNVGTIEIELYPWVAPKNVNNIVQLTKDGFYDGKKFHRVIQGEVIQMGGFDRGSKSMDVLDYKIPDEINPKDLKLSDELIAQYEESGYEFNYKVRSMPLRYGVVAMANQGPNTNQSQVFIVTNPDGLQYLNGRYTPLGQVVQGTQAMLQIDQAKTDSFDEPLDEFYIMKATIR
ncbi:MAG: peptidylprolyl isomerase [Caldisericia bacterium]|nr:peptidylprolyl isomerase [Caldisericia bacterium]